jgi:LuxR family transcriptional regulator
MKSWEEELLAAIINDTDPAEVFKKIENAARSLDFEHCAYGTRMPWPFSRPRVYLINNYPTAWQARYQEAGYMHIDPTVAHCRKSEAPVVWSDDVFAQSPGFWDEAQSFGLRFGWAQSSLDANGGAGMLSLGRSSGPLSASELAAKESKMRWLVHLSHLRLTRTVSPQLNAQLPSCLTNREVEVLKWTGDGKTSSEISEILVLSTDTVNFHLKNAISKLGVANKTAAVACAAMLGMLH